ISASFIVSPNCVIIFSGQNVDATGRLCFIFFLCIVALLLPTILIGLSFPLASELTVMRMSALGRRIGTLYALNTIGGVLGSLTAGFVLIPYLGSQTALNALILMNMLLFAAIAASQPGLLTSLRRQGAIAFTVIV